VPVRPPGEPPGPPPGKPPMPRRRTKKSLGKSSCRAESPRRSSPSEHASPSPATAFHASAHARSVPSPQSPLEVLERTALEPGAKPLLPGGDQLMWKQPHQRRACPQISENNAGILSRARRSEMDRCLSSPPWGGEAEGAMGGDMRLPLPRISSAAAGAVDLEDSATRSACSETSSNSSADPVAATRQDGRRSLVGTLAHGSIDVFDSAMRV